MLIVIRRNIRDGPHLRR